MQEEQLLTIPSGNTVSQRHGEGNRLPRTTVHSWRDTILAPSHYFAHASPSGVRRHLK